MVKAHWLAAGIVLVSPPIAAPPSSIASEVALTSVGDFLVAIRSEPIACTLSLVLFVAITMALGLSAVEKQEWLKVLALSYAAAFIGLSVGLACQPIEPGSVEAHGWPGLSAAVPALVAPALTGTAGFVAVSLGRLRRGGAAGG